MGDLLESVPNALSNLPNSIRKVKREPATTGRTDLYPRTGGQCGQQRLTSAPARPRHTALLAGVAVIACAVALVGCGGSSSTPQATLRTYLADWSRGDWAGMQRLVSKPPASFAATNAAAFTALGVRTATFTAGM